MKASLVRWVSPDWPAPDHVRALTTERNAGQPDRPFDGFNLADHVQDDPERVATHRSVLVAQLGLAGQPQWLTQVHGIAVERLDGTVRPLSADGSFTTSPGVVCAVLSADCAPVFLSDRQGSFVALLHAGWRGIADGIIEAGLSAVPAQPRDIIAWVGPGIRRHAFEVKSEVRDQLMADHQRDSNYFLPRGERYLADLPGLILARLRQYRVAFAGASEVCTYADPTRWFSFRRQGLCGRMASLIWLERQR